MNEKQIHLLDFYKQCWKQRATYSAYIETTKELFREGVSREEIIQVVDAFVTQIGNTFEDKLVQRYFDEEVRGVFLNRVFHKCNESIGFVFDHPEPDSELRIVYYIGGRSKKPLPPLNERQTEFLNLLKGYLKMGEPPSRYVEITKQHYLQGMFRDEIQRVVEEFMNGLDYDHPLGEQFCERINPPSNLFNIFQYPLPDDVIGLNNEEENGYEISHIPLNESERELYDMYVKNWGKRTSYETYVEITKKAYKDGMSSLQIKKVLIKFQSFFNWIFLMQWGNIGEIRRYHCNTISYLLRRVHHNCLPIYRIFENPESDEVLGIAGHLPDEVRMPTRPWTNNQNLLFENYKDHWFERKKHAVYVETTKQAYRNGMFKEEIEIVVDKFIEFANSNGAKYRLEAYFKIEVETFIARLSCHMPQIYDIFQYPEPDNELGI